MDAFQGNVNSLISRQFPRQKLHPYSTINDSALGIVIRDFRIQRFGIPHDRMQMDKDGVKKITEANRKPLTSTQYKDVHIFTATARHHRENDSLGGVAVNIWETTTFSERSAFCCLLYENGEIKKLPVIRKSSFLNNTLTPVQILCKPPDYATSPFALTLAYENDVCPLTAEFYVETANSKNCSEKLCFALCAKIAYGMLNPEILIEWMEYYRHMDVSYVVVLTYNLTVTAMDVLHFYEKERWVEVLAFDYPSKGQYFTILSLIPLFYSFLQVLSSFYL